MKKAIPAVALACCGLASVAMAGEKPQLQKVERGVKVTPKRIAGINSRGERITPWYDYKGGERPAGTDLIFDCFDPDSTGAPEDEDGCGLGSSRWYFGTTYVNPFIGNDMTAEPNAGLIDGIQMAWYWGQEGQCTINVFSGSAFSDDCTADFGDIPDGVALDFGPLDGDTGFYYYAAIVDLEGAGLSIPTGASYLMQLTDGANLATGTGCQFRAFSDAVSSS